MFVWSEKPWMGDSINWSFTLLFKFSSLENCDFASQNLWKMSSLSSIHGNLFWYITFQNENSLSWPDFISLTPGSSGHLEKIPTENNENFTKKMWDK